MLDRVLDDRLEDQVRDPRAAQVGRDVERHPQPVLEARLLDLEVHLEELELAGERHELRRVGLEAAAEELLEARDRERRRVPVAEDERQDAVESVEEKVGVELRLESLRAARP